MLSSFLIIGTSPNYDVFFNLMGMDTLNYKEAIQKEIEDTGKIIEDISIQNKITIKKGNIPMNKGKKWDDYMPKEKQKNCRKTTFKKGNKPSNAVDIGEEHMRYSGSKPDDLGYLHIKVCDGKGNKNWIPKHRYIYEQHHGKIPPGHKVIFADGDRFNFDIDNLILVSESEELLMNRHNLRFEDKELTKTGSIIAKVMDKTHKVKNDRL